MTLGIGLVGAGVMGADHARTIARHVAGARLVAVADADGDRAARVAAETGARAGTDGHAVIAASDVAAVLIASPDNTHADLVHACLEAGKPVLCEKPLAPTPAECLDVIEAELALGRRLIQVGFMRRFDPAYVAMKRTLDAGNLGRALLFHCIHRNAVVPAFFDSGMIVTNSAVHEFDIARWLLGCDIVRIQVFGPADAGPGGPLMVMLENQARQLIDIELFMNAAYGYDVRGELVCEKGTVSLAVRVDVHLRQAGAESFGFAPDWRPRFAAAYRAQLQDWVNAIASGRNVGASAWDGYAAMAVAAAGLRSLGSGQPVDVTLQPRPTLYA